MSRMMDEGGFTLVELLIVVVVIGLLAAMLTPGLLTARKQSSDVVAKSHVRSLVRAVEECRSSRDSYSDCNTATELGDPGVPYGVDPGNAVVAAAAPDTFTVRAVSEAASAGQQHQFTLSRLASGAYRRECTPAGEGGCKDAPDADGNSW